MAAAIAALAVTGLLHSNQQATANAAFAAAQAPSTASVPLSVPLDSGEVQTFTFGYLEFDWDPARGMPGFSALPPQSRQQ